MRISFRGMVLLAGACILTGAAALAQQTQSQAKPAQISTDLAVTFATERSDFVPGQCCFWFKGCGADAAVTFWKGFCIAASLTGDRDSDAAPGVNIAKIAFLAGPRYSWTSYVGDPYRPRLQVFGQGLFGGAHAFDGVYPTSTGTTPTASSFAIEAGGGINIFLTRNFGLRVIEADYVRTALPNGTSNVQDDLRLAFGITYRLGHHAQPVPVTLSADASPATVFPGDPVTVTASAGNLDSSLNAVYTWAGNGVTGNGTTAAVATASLTPGPYTVTVQVKEGKNGKEGLKPWESAEASASFTVKPFEPPTVACSANPGTIKTGETSTISVTGLSPQNRPLKYGLSASSGTVSGIGSAATYASAGAPTGPVTITCTVTDDKDQTATSTALLTILAPPIPPLPHTQALASISFERDKKRPARVDNEAKAILDGVALSVQEQPDATAVVVGEATVAEKAPKKSTQAELDDLAAQRAVNTKAYLVTEKGIDAGRISVRTGTADRQTAESYLVPSGADFAADVADASPVDQTKVKPQDRKPLPAKPGQKKKVVAAAK